MNLSLSHEKCKILLTEGVVLGNHVSSEGIKVDLAKIEVIVRFTPHKTQKEVRSFLGHAGYYWRFIENFTKIVAPMFGLLIKYVDFVWTEQCQSAFETLKAKLSMTPFLRGTNWTLPFQISIDASDAYEVFVHTNHSTIRFLMNKPITNGQVTMWLLLLQEFNIIVLD
jgi:hypothetical protein